MDALVALSILAVTVSLSLQAAQAASRAAARADEVRRADTLLRYVLESRTSNETERSAGFSWRVQVSPFAGPTSAGSVQLCRRAAQARARRTGRLYALTAIFACPAESAA